MRLTNISPEGLPSWLYYPAQETDRSGYSPVALFNPANANNNPYESMTSPSEQLQKKTLVVTPETEASAYANSVFSYLALQGFFMIKWEPLNRVFSNEDYRLFYEQYTIPRDFVVILEGKNWHDLLFFMRTRGEYIQDNSSYSEVIKKSLKPFSYLNKPATVFIDAYDTNMISFLSQFSYYGSIRFTPEVLADPNTVFALFNDSQLNKKLSQDNLFELAEAHVEVAKILLKRGVKCQVYNYGKKIDDQTKLSEHQIYQLGKKHKAIADMLLLDPIHNKLLDNKQKFYLKTEHYPLDETTWNEFEEMNAQGIFFEIIIINSSASFFEKLMHKKNYALSDINAKKNIILIAEYFSHYFNFENQEMLYFFDSCRVEFKYEFFYELASFINYEYALKIIDFLIFSKDKAFFGQLTDQAISYLFEKIGSMSIKMANYILHDRNLLNLMTGENIENLKIIRAFLIALDNVDEAFIFLKHYTAFNLEQLTQLALTHVEIAESLLYRTELLEKMKPEETEKLFVRIWLKYPLLRKYMQEYVQKKFVLNNTPLLSFSVDINCFSEVWNEWQETKFSINMIYSITFSDSSKNLNGNFLFYLKSYGNFLFYLKSLIKKSSYLSEIHIPEELERVFQTFLDEPELKTLLKDRKILLITRPTVLTNKVFAPKTIPNDVVYNQNKHTTNDVFTNLSLQQISSKADPRCLYCNTSKTKKFNLSKSLETSKTSSIQHYQQEPVFFIDSDASQVPLDQSIQVQLKNMMRMSLQEIYSYDNQEGNPKKVESRELTPISMTLKKKGDIVIRVINFDLLSRFEDGGYIIPVLHSQQCLLSSEGGIIQKDSFSRWIFYCDSTCNDIKQAKLSFSIPLDKSSQTYEYINASNYQDAYWNQVLGIKVIRYFFEEKYPDCEQKKIICESRVRLLLQKNPSNIQNMFYGSTNGHAYLITKNGESNFIRVDLGGTDNFEQTFVPVPDEVKEKINHFNSDSSDDAHLKPMQYSQHNNSESSSSVDVHVEHLLNVLDTQINSDSSDDAHLKPMQYSQHNNSESSSSVDVHVEHLLNVLDTQKKVLLQHKNSHDLLLSILAWKAKRQENVYTIRQFSDIDFEKKCIKMDKERKPIKDSEGFIANFFEQASVHPNKKHSIIVYLDNLRSEQRVQINTLWEGTLQGRRVPKNISIVSLTKNTFASMDDSLVTRQESCMEVSEKLLAEFNKWNHEQSLSAYPSNGQYATSLSPIDCAGRSDWKATLFGSILLDNSNNKIMHWELSDFRSQLDHAVQNNITTLFVIKNWPIERMDEIQEYFKEAKAQGYFSYHGAVIPYPAFISIDLSRNPFDFTAFDKIDWHILSPNDDLSTGVFVNTHVFDHLIREKNVDKNQQLYQTLPGQIEKNKNNSLILNITSSLSDSQWYCLLYEAKKHNVALQLRLAEEILLPKGLKNQQYFPVKQMVQIDQNLPKLYFTNNADTLSASFNEPLTFDIEDLSYQDLFYRDLHDEDSTGFSNFRHEKSDLLTALTNLTNKKTVILKGKFSPTLLHYMHSILATGVIHHAGEEPVMINGNLILCIEEPTLTEETAQQLKILQAWQLAWLPNIHFSYVDSKAVQEKIREKIVEPAETIDWENLTLADLSVEKANAFWEQRQTIVTRCLADYSKVLITGETSTGKSSLLREWGEKGMKIYDGLEAFESWVNDHSTDNLKILRLDEYNLINSHLTLLAPLNASYGSTLFYKGKFFPVDTQHKMVALGNPIEYGSGRLSQKLFDNQDVGEIEFKDFHPAYIYQKLLLPIYQQASQDIQKALSEDHFKKYCLRLLKKYGLQQHVKPPITVRKLQEYVLDYLSFPDLINLMPELSKKSNANPNYYHKEQKTIYDLLERKLHLYDLQFEGKLPHKNLGLKMVLFVGESGIGKTEMIKRILNEHQYKEKYIKIDASLSLAQQKKLIRIGFRHGYILWIDEINALLKTDLERDLNAVLTGEDPDGLPAPEKPCLVFATANKAYREGRAEISPAIMARCNYYECKSTKNYREEKRKKQNDPSMISKITVPENIYEKTVENLENNQEKKCLKISINTNRPVTCLASIEFLSPPSSIGAKFFLRSIFSGRGKSRFLLMDFFKVKKNEKFMSNENRDSSLVI